MDRETVFSDLFESVSKGKRDRDQNVVQTNGKLNWPSEEKEWLSKRFFEAEADVEVKLWEKRNTDIALYEINQEFDSERLLPQQANQWAEQAQRDKTCLHGKLEKQVAKTLKN